MSHTAFDLQPPPLRTPMNQKAWSDWFRDLHYRLYNGVLSWAGIDFTGSNLTDIATRNHSGLQNIAGSADAYHVSSATFSELARMDAAITVSANTAMTDAYSIYIADTSSITLTLPAAGAARVGKQWTVVQDVAGFVDVAPAGSDEIILRNGSDTIRLRQAGSTLVLRCVSATQWVIV